MSKESKPDNVTRETTSFLGSGLGTVHSTTVHKGDNTYTGSGWTKEKADQKAGDKYRKGQKDQ